MPLVVTLLLTPTMNGGDGHGGDEMLMERSFGWKLGCKGTFRVIAAHTPARFAHESVDCFPVRWHAGPTSVIARYEPRLDTAGEMVVGYHCPGRLVGGNDELLGLRSALQTSLETAVLQK
ncbi:hypothetical protein GRJ2_001415600 [Grus japonensis]|uniref:Uncharacterized protein n=1 Tax=Grus japonensis TaxID=30415 RepID=A0ABC9WVT8_GRUJA